MNRCPIRLVAFAFSVLFAAAASQCALAEEKTARDLFPPSIVAYAEVPRAAGLVELVLDHPLVAELQKNPEFQQGLQSPQFRQVQEAVKLLEERLRMPYRNAAGAITSGGIHVAVDLPSQGVGVLTRAKDAEVAAKARDFVLEIARTRAQAEGKPDPVKTEEVRGIATHKIDQVYVSAFGPWLLVTNKELLLRLVLENHAAGGSSLGQEEQFRAAYDARRADAAAWVYVDLRVLNLTGILKKAADTKSDNPPIEVLAGGVVDALPQAKYATATLDVSQEGVCLTAVLICSSRAIADKREFYFGADGKGEAPPLLKPKQSILSLSTYRDFASLWRHAPDLFDEQINAKFAEAESNLTTLFAGRNFRDEILGNIEPAIQLVVTRQQYPVAGGITPAVKLPAGAAVVRMKDPAETARIFKITYQSLIGFLNVVGGMNGLDPLDLNSEKIGDVLVISAEYLPPRKPEERTEAKMHFNASPTVAFVGDKFIVASARPLAMELIDLVKKGAEGPSANTALEFDAQLLQSVLADNRSSLVSQNMIQKGHDQAAAEKEVDVLLALVRRIGGASLALAADDKSLRLSLDVRLVPGEE